MYVVFVILFSPVFDPIHLIYHDVSIIQLFVCLVTSIFGNLLLFSLTSGLRRRSGFCRMASCLSVSDSIQDHSYAHVFLCKLLSHISSDVFWGWNMLLLSCTLSVSCCIWYSASATKSVASANSGSLSICPFSVTLAFTLVIALLIMASRSRLNKAGNNDTCLFLHAFFFICVKIYSLQYKRSAEQ